MGDNGVEKPSKKTNTAFKQQRLPAWLPVLNAGTVLPAFFVIGILFVPIGIGMLYLSFSVLECVIDYTDCTSGGRKCADIILNQTFPNVSCTCDDIHFQLSKPMVGQVYIYYELDNFYQNYHRYTGSKDDDQLHGEVGTLSNPKTPNSKCGIFSRAHGKIIYPCGAIANSLFTDKIKLLKDGVEVPLSKKGIAWDSDKRLGLKNPSFWEKAQGNSSHPAWKKFTKPKDWNFELWEWKEGVQDEDFIVWMRISAFHNSRKLFRFVDHKNATVALKNGLPAGNYTLSVSYSYKVKKFGGTKSIILSTTSVLGGKGVHLGITYIVAGGVCLIFGICFLVIHIYFGPRNLIMVKESNTSTPTTGNDKPKNNLPPDPHDTNLKTDAPVAVKKNEPKEVVAT